jgi:hypothetical protein
MDVLKKEWHQLTIEIYLDSVWSMIHLKTWDIFSTKHPKFLFFVFNLFEVFDFHFEISLWSTWLHFEFHSTWFPHWFHLISWVPLSISFLIPRWFVDFHTSISQTEQKAKATQTTSKATKVSLA